MWKARDIFPAALLVAALALFGVGVVHLMALRFGAGDIYPPYSSLRADPLGAKVFCESLRRLPEHGLQRHLQAWDKLPDGYGTTLFVLGIQHPESYGRTSAECLMRFAADGGRVVLTLAPYRLARMKADDKAQRQDEASPGTDSESPPKKDDEHDTLCHRLAFDVGSIRLGAHSPSAAAQRGSVGGPAAGLPEQFPWPGPMCFRGLGSTWQTIYACAGQPVIVERNVGRGTVVLLADSYPLSNEAMQTGRNPHLLAWLLGENRLAIFDESHLGIQVQPGIMSLMRRYRLHGLLLGMALLAVLFAWRGLSPLIPAASLPVVTDDAAAIMGKDDATGLVNLLCRGIPDKDILETCVAEWIKTAAHNGNRATARTSLVQAVLEDEARRPPAQRDAVAAYRKICAIVAERRLAGGN